MQTINLVKFYQLGKELKNLSKLKTGAEMFDVEGGWFMLVGIKPWLHAFWEETKALSIPKTRKAMGRLDREVRNTCARLMADFAAKKEPTLTQEENTAIREALGAFEKEFELDSRSLGVFGVTPKDDRDLAILVEDAIQNWPQNVLAIMPDKAKDDLREAGRCLAFERPTACAFHICRATEALMLAYYERLAGKTWPHQQRDWGRYNAELAALNAPDQITTRLDEIRKMDRNAYAHPDKTVPLDEGPILYGLCRNVIYLITKEML